jgi:hypothetical protein
MKALPNCPCRIKVSQHCVAEAGPGSGMVFTTATETLDSVSSDQDAGWILDYDIVVNLTRKGVATYCMRSKPTNTGARQECCYDSDGKLITGGAGAGTVDRGSGFGGHYEADYAPYTLAVKCDKIRGGNSCVLKYLEVRPVNNGNNCEKNEPR